MMTSMGTGGVRRGPRVPDLMDFVTQGIAEQVSPHPLFDLEFYAAQRPELAERFAAGLNPLVHYRSRGAAEGMNPHPLFDTRFYLAQCPEALEAGSDPVSHYATVGWRQGLDPHPLFSTTYYLQHARDVANAGLNPLLHFLQSGCREGRPVSPYFDERAYLRRYSDVASSGLSSLLHFVLRGSAEGRSASPLLSFRIANDRRYDRPGGGIDFARDEQDSYLAWVRMSARVPAARRMRAAAEIGQFRYRPTVSILLHVTAATAGGLGETLQSIRGQVYEDWQLCVAVDAGVGGVDQLLSLSSDDGRVRVLQRGTAEEPAFALNGALDAARGDYVALVAAGDRLHGLALSTLLSGLQGERGRDLVYADEDGLDAGMHVDPVFKPDWSPELLLGMDFLSRSSLIRAGLVREAGGFRPGFAGAAPYDLMLRLLPRLDAGLVLHIPRPLYHRRVEAGNADARHDGMYRALKEHTERDGFASAVVRGQSPERFRVAFEPREEAGAEPLVSVVIPTGNASFAGPLGQEWVLDNCIRSLRKGTAWGALEIVVVHDGNLSRAQLAALEAAKVKLVAYDRPVFNFSRKINLGVRASTGDYVLILNDDIEAKRRDWLLHLMGHLQQPGIGVVGPKLFLPHGCLQHTGIVVQHGNPGHLYYRASGTDPGYLEMNDMPRNWLAVTGACQLVRRSTFDSVGGYDEGLPLNFNDVDFCLRVLDRGLRTVYVPQAELYHFEGVTKIVEIGNQLTKPEETHYFQARWRTRYPVDPYYHPDLPPWMPLGLRQPEEARMTPGQARKLPAPALAKARSKGVNWLGPTNRSSGMGTAARSYVAAMQTAGLATRLVNLDRIFGHQSEVEHGLANTSQDFPITMILANADTTAAVLEQYGDEFGRARYRIGLWVWELPAARPEWQQWAALYDEIWVPSTFCETAFKAITRTPVTLVPYSVQGLPSFGASDRARVRARLDLAPDAFVFLYMFDTFSFVDRKNPLPLLEAFEREFCGDPRAVLLLKISYYANLASGYSPENQAILLRLEDIVARCPNVRIMTEILPQEEVYGLIDAADCYVSPHRSEGFGLTVAEAMYYGKPVIATDFGATTDFVQEGVGLPLRYRLVELTEDRGPYAKGNVWAEPSVEHLRELMRRVLEDAALRESVGKAGRSLVMRRYSLAAVGQMARKRLGAIAAGL